MARRPRNRELMPDELQALSFAFWREVMIDLLSGDWETKLWLTSRGLGSFLWWCRVTDKRPAEWRGMLLTLYGMAGTPEGERKMKKLREAT